MEFPTSVYFTTARGGTDVNPYVRVRRVISRGSGFSHGHTNWPFDFVSKPGVASISPKNMGGAVPIRKVVVPVSIVVGGKLKVGLPGGSCLSFFWRVFRVGFLPVLIGVTLVVDSGSTLPFRKRKNIPSMGHGQKNGRTESNVSRKAKTWIPSPFVPKDSVVFSRPPQTPTIHTRTCAAPHIIVDSPAVHAVHLEGGT